MVLFSQRMAMKRLRNISFVEYGATMSFEISTADAILSIGPFGFHSDGSRERGGQEATQ